jgi:ABC-2 type transport system permease protein
MTAQLAAGPQRPVTTATAFGDVLRSEWTKLRSVRSTYWTAAVAALCIVALGVFMCVRYSQLIPADGPGKLYGFDPTLTSLDGLFLAQIAVGTLGVLVITSEYATGMIRTTFSAVPQRRLVLAAKALVFGGATLVAAEVLSFLTFGVGQAILGGTDPGRSGITPSASLGDPGVLRAVAGAGLYLAAVGLLGFGLGAMIRHTAGALSAFFGLLFGASVLTDLLPTGWRNAVLPYMPANAGSDIFTVVPSHDALAPWTGLGVFCLYAAVALAIGCVVIKRRDA